MIFSWVDVLCECHRKGDAATLRGPGRRAKDPH